MNWNAYSLAHNLKESCPTSSQEKTKKQRAIIALCTNYDYKHGNAHFTLSLLLSYYKQLA
jgi:hypothetical protein